MHVHQRLVCGKLFLLRSHSHHSAYHVNSVHGKAHRLCKGKMVNFGLVPSRNRLTVVNQTLPR